MTHHAETTDSAPRARLNKLTDWRMQLRLIGWFLAAGTFALGLQYILTVNQLTAIAMEHALDPGAAFESAQRLTRRVLLVSIGVTLPLTTVIGVLATARLAGPLHRLTRFLEATTRGEAPPDCQLRRGDELTGFCELLNDATRASRASTHDDEPDARDAAGSQRAA